MDIAKILFLILRSVKRQVMERLSGELTFLEFKCLKIVYGGKATQKEIVEETGLTKGTVSKALKSLEEKGLITRKRDGREYVIHLTEEGKAMIKKLERIASEINEKMLRGFEREEVKILERLLERILRNLE
ncbi:transcriptional regulator, MarR family [Ferroglobus placidus DSM 10642]|uniref:Transcriptional regulator, MarR family n=1 Tax=Ferroglobus placidus (strain DSM 10642 / AEDII12DO) TaxID=589924 RepID=D3RZX4_FERPA|nr:MarR family transcriptional regulator [Ferroglobus placidus]ADC66037.1 transcriptional regulator, MarR family [Ferroglobus placidus DSM 10642]